MRFAQIRPWLIYWLYALFAVHLVTGILLSWFIQLPQFESYHQLILGKFYFGKTLTEAYGLQLWWIKLFGATLQNLAIFMGVLIYLGNRTRIAGIWGWMILGLLVWAPQDMYISAQREIWMHLWIDGAVLVAMLPPLFILWRHDAVEKSL